MLNDIEEVGCFVNDIVISGNKQKEVDWLYTIYNKLDAVGLAVHKDKYEYYKSKVTFLGYTIVKNVLHIPSDKL